MGAAIYKINAPFSFYCFSVCVQDIIDMIQCIYGTENKFTEDCYGKNNRTDY